MWGATYYNIHAARDRPAQRDADRDHPQDEVDLGWACDRLAKLNTRRRSAGPWMPLAELNSPRGESEMLIVELPDSFGALRALV